MSRLGKLPIQLPAGTEAKIQDGVLIVKGPKGELKQAVSELVKIEIKDNVITVSVADSTDKKQRSFWGLYWRLVSNMVLGVNEGFEKKLEIHGVGYRAAISGQKLTLTLGYSHPVIFDVPIGITAIVADNVITINGIDKQLVGEIAAQIRKKRKPDVYKNKGIKYADEVLIKKEGKTAAKGE